MPRHPSHRSAIPTIPVLLLGLLAALPLLAQANTTLTDLPGAVVSANSCYLSSCTLPGTFSALNAIDHQPYSRLSGQHGWNAGDHGSVGDPNWWRIDFGASYSLSSVKLEFGDNLGAYQGYNNVYQLLSSSDGTHWQLIGSGTLTDLTGNLEALTDNYSWTGAERPVARWLEYRVVGGSHWSELSEISVTGTPYTAAVPEPGSYALMSAGLLAMGWLSRRRSQAGR